MESVAGIIITISMISGPISFFIAIIGLFKPTWVIRRPSLQTRAGAFFLWVIVGSCFTIGGSILASAITDYYKVDYKNYFVGSKGANVRECPEITCKIIDTLPANEEIRLAYQSLDDLPDWVEVSVENKYTGQEKVGYVSKTVLSSKLSSVTPAIPISGGDQDGIYLGSGNFDPLIIGYSYEFSFCVPDSARSGATCGGLAGKTDSPVGGFPPYSFVKGSGFLPPGMSLELNGLLSGSPTTAGTYNFKICAKDLHMNQGCENYNLVVKNEETIIDQSSNGRVLSSTEDAAVVNATLISGKCGQSYRDESQLYEPKIRWNGWYWEAEVSGPVGTFMQANFANDIDCGDWHKIYEDDVKCERNSYLQPSTTRVKAKNTGTVYPPGVQSGIFATWGNNLDNEYYLDIIYSCQ